MRIPPSLIIMSLVTATPFGLAIRDTLTKKPMIEMDDGDPYGLDLRTSSRHDREEYERYEAEMEKEAAEKAEKRIEATARLSMLFGAKPATLGALFDGIRLGADSSSFQPESARARIEAESDKGFITVSFDTDSTALRGVNIAISSGEYDTAADESMCRSLHDKLVAAWGPGTKGTWLDETKHQRVVLSSEGRCTLDFERTLQPAEWLAMVPADLVGKAAKVLDDYATNNAISFEDEDDETARWYIPAMGIASGQTTITAMIVNRKVVGLRVSGAGDWDSIVAVRDALTKKLNAKPVHDEDNDTYTWKHKPAAQMTVIEGDDHFDLLIGKDPWE